jgi:hypothetical protein
MKDDLPWIKISKSGPYFTDENGTDWAPLGFNEAMNWPNLNNLIDRRETNSVERYFQMLSDHGVTCLRLMMEDCHKEGFFLETTVGEFSPRVVQFWDDLFLLCSKYKIRLLIAPYDTFWMWINWKKHPYNSKNGGPCKDVRTFLTDSETRKAIKNRFKFFTERWGSTGTLFAWDLWNEIHPGYAGDQTNIFDEYIGDISRYLERLENKIHGKRHLRTISVFGPLLIEGFTPRAGRRLVRDPRLAECIFSNDYLDFANAHTYEEGTIDHPKDTVKPAIAMGMLTGKAIAQIKDRRPYFDSEHGPIHTFKDHRKTLPDSFDSEYERHMSWAHLASGGAGGGMRWPNRNPHVLTRRMYDAMSSMSKFLQLINWNNFVRKVLNRELDLSSSRVSGFACGNTKQAILWLVRTDTINSRRMLSQIARPALVFVGLPHLGAGTYRVTLWNTLEGRVVGRYESVKDSHQKFLNLTVNVISDIAIAITKIEE